jgi:hypothetical protein
MADIMRVIGSDDPALVDLKTQAILSGLNLADRAHNMMDTDRTVIAKDIDWVTGLVRKQYGGKMAKVMRAILEGSMEHSSEVAFEYVINATKMAVFAQMNNRLRQKALQAGRWWDPVRDMKKWANYINAEVGGIDPAMYPWMTPGMQQFLKAIMFSWEWTLGAWEAGGGNILTQKWFGRTTPGNIRGFMIGRWARMYGSVMFGLPMFMQLVITAAAKAAGDDGPDDKWFTTQNEIGHGYKDFDITPMLRMMANQPLLFIPGLPSLGDIKKKNIPVISSLIPALTGQEGDQATTRKRRYYMHLGKQGWEIAGWFENPAKSFLSKMSMPAQRILEGVLGITPSMGWEMPFAETGFWERWTSLDPEKSALLNLTGAVMPFSVMSLERAPEAGAISLFGPISKGISKTRAINDMAAEFTRWADADSYIAQRKGVKGAWTDLQSMGVEWIDALRMNGYDPKESLKEALTKARRPLYEKIHKALPVFPSDRADTQALEEAARGLYRLNYVAKDMMKSIRARDKAQHIKRTGDLSVISNEAMRDAFANPYGAAGTTRDAAFGGDVRGLLATDEVPATMLGYAVVPQERMSETQKKYFVDNPQAAGHFEPAGRTTNPARDDLFGGDVNTDTLDITVKKHEDPSERVGFAKGVIAREQELVNKATPWFMRPTKLFGGGVSVKRLQGYSASGTPIYTPVGEKAVKAPSAVSTAVSAVAARAGDAAGVASDLAGLAPDVSRGIKKDLVDLGNARKNIDREAGKAYAREMSKAAGFKIEVPMGTPAEATQEYKGTGISIAPPTAEPGTKDYQEDKQFQNRVLMGGSF